MMTKSCWMLCFLSLAGCAGGGGGEAVLTLRIDNLTGPAYAGEPMTFVVIAMRGGQVAADYQGELTFETTAPDATTPRPYTVTLADAGRRAFVRAFVFPTGIHTLTVSAAGVQGSAQLDLDVSERIATLPPSTPSNAPVAIAGPVAKIGVFEQIVPSVSVGLSLAIADFDGDGRDDLVVGTPGGIENLLYPTTGDDLFFAVEGTNFAPGQPFSSDHMAALATDRIDADQFADLAYVLDDGKIAVRLNDGFGGFGESTVFGSQAKIIALGDLDGDGDVDVLAGGAFVQAWLNNGRGGFEDGGRVEVAVTALALADLDGDGDLDAVHESGTLFNDGTGAFQQGTQRLCPDVISGLVTAVDTADLDGDGDIDLAFGVYGLPNLVYTNDGTGAFSITAELGKNCTMDIMFIDVDLDGLPDLFSSNQTRESRVWVNNGDGSFTETTHRGGGTGYSVKGDLDGDGDNDMVLLSLAGFVDAYRLVVLNDPSDR